MYNTSFVRKALLFLCVALAGFRPQAQTGPCTSPPVPGTVSAAPGTRINTGSNFTLSINGGTSGTGQVYQWESSSDNVSYSPIPGANANVFSTSLQTSQYYRCAVTCSSFTERTAGIYMLTSDTFTINNNIPPSNTNFQSFGDAINSIRYGISGPVLFEVDPGSNVYNEQVIIPIIAGMSATNTVTFRGHGATIQYSPATTANKAGITLNGADHVIIDGLQVDVSNGTYGWGILLTNQADSNVIRKCTVKTKNNVTGSDFYGIMINGSTSSAFTPGYNGNANLIDSNTTIGGYHGIFIYGNNNLYNVNNVISRNSIQDAYNHSLYIFGNNRAAVSGNEITRPNRTAIGSGTGVYVASVVGTLFEKNSIHNLFDGVPGSSMLGYGFNITSPGADTAINRLENNLVYNMNNGTGGAYGIYIPGFNYWKIYHNTIAFNETTPTAGFVYGIYAFGDGISVKNNIVSITRSGTGTKYCLYYQTRGPSESNNNILYMNAASGSNYIGYYNTAIATLSDWQNVKNKAFDQQSFSLDPLFVNTLANDYTPAEPRINNTGTPGLNILTDIKNVTRGSAPDPGAYEFTIAGCTTPPVAGTATASVQDVCQNTTFNLNLTGNSLGEGQTFQWQRSDNANGPWSNVSNELTAPLFVATQTAGSYYRCAVKCSGGTVVYSGATGFISSPSLVSGSFTINKGQPASASNFTSFADAVNFIKCGINGPVVFNVTPGSGPYNEQVTIPEINGTSATNTVTFNGNGESLVSSPTTSMRYGLGLNGADYIILNNLKVNVSSGTSLGWGIALAAAADNNIIRNCTITTASASTATGYIGLIFNYDLLAYGTIGNSANNNLVQNNTITGGYYGIYIYGNSNIPTDGNSITDNTVTDAYFAGIYINGNKNFIIRRNNISRPTRSVNGNFYGISINSCGGNGLVEKNQVHNLYDALTTVTTSTCYGIYVTSSTGINAASPSRIENNLLYSMNSNGGTIYGIWGFNNPYWNIYHNTVHLDNRVRVSNTAPAATYGIYFSGAGVNIKNNIVYLTRGGTGDKYALYFGSGTVGSCNRNVLYVNTPDATGNIGYYNTAFATLSSWNTANGGVWDLNSKTDDPAFANIAANDFTPSATAVNNIGEYVNVLTDINENPRSQQTPDPGAIEFGSSMPLTWMGFTAEASGNYNKLYWSTANEVNNQGFDVQKSTDGRQFTTIGYVGAAGSGTTVNRYNYTDVAPYQGITYYRLQQADKDGRRSFSAIQSVSRSKALSVQLFPNPASQYTVLTVTGITTGKMQYLLYDPAGRLLKQQLLPAVNGAAKVSIDVQGFARGVYLLNLTDGQGGQLGSYKLIRE